MRLSKKIRRRKHGGDEHEEEKYNYAELTLAQEANELNKIENNINYAEIENALFDEEGEVTLGMMMGGGEEEKRKYIKALNKMLDEWNIAKNKLSLFYINPLANSTDPEYNKIYHTSDNKPTNRYRMTPDLLRKYIMVFVEKCINVNKYLVYIKTRLLPNMLDDANIENLKKTNNFFIKRTVKIMFHSVSNLSNDDNELISFIKLRKNEILKEIEKIIETLIDLLGLVDTSASGGKRLIKTLKQKYNTMKKNYRKGGRGGGKKYTRHNKSFIPLRNSFR